MCVCGSGGGEWGVAALRTPDSTTFFSSLPTASHPSIHFPHHLCRTTSLNHIQRRHTFHCPDSIPDSALRSFIWRRHGDSLTESRRDSKKGKTRKSGR
ncbi:hypothetical protein E2C01_095619 [Portunus trituberculatus]|uniref:Uncharacterized protein n=1 Tax=Portunus trituberculatus TaxID=210409 RepID=A0A5B7JVR0_PORTR|nr:hypothetical protein [Portunus trituberculatus]